MAQGSKDDRKELTINAKLQREHPSSTPERPSNVNDQGVGRNGEPQVGISIEDENPRVGGPGRGFDRSRPTMDAINPEGYEPQRRVATPSYSSNPTQSGVRRSGSSLPENDGGLGKSSTPGLSNEGKTGLSDGGSRGIESPSSSARSGSKQGGGTPAPGNGAAGKGTPNQNESAPDVGKDYGSSSAGSGSGTGGANAKGKGENPEGEGSNGERSDDLQAPDGPAGEKGDANADGEIPRETGVGNQADAQKKGQDGSEGGKGDGLKKEGEDGKKPGEEAAGGQQGRQQGQAQNPEAKGGKNAPIAEENAGKPQPEQNVGNGYGALRNRSRQQNANPDNGDVTRRARANAGRNQGGQGDGAAGSRWPKGNGSTGSINTPVHETFGQRARNYFKNRLTGGENKGGERNTDHDAKIAGTGFSSQWGEVAKNWLLAHPLVLIALIVGLIVLLLLLAGAEVNTNGGQVLAGAHCNYNLSGILSTGTVNLDSIQVELINCDGKKDNYKVIETVDFEKYVIGVAWAETQYHPDNPEYFKASIVAVRGFSLTRNKSMCPSNPDNCFFGYNPNTGKIRLRNCSNDQNYCDYERTCYRKERSGNKALTGLEAEQEGPTRVWYEKPSEETKAAMLQAAAEVKGKVLVDTSGNVVYTNYVNTDQQHWAELGKQGKNYEEILKEHYASSNASGMTSATCSNYGNIDYGDYVLSSEGHEILHEPLESFLQSKGTSLEQFNSLISGNVDKAGYGTRAGVVAAAVTLIGELGNNYGVKVPYFWGGGHADGVVDGALGKWGSSQCHTYANDQSYDYCGLDCSGFVPWAIKNGGFNIAQMLAGNFQYLDGAQRVSLSSSSAVLQPGDLLESEHHIVLVIGIEESSGSYICAEASGNAKGVLFTRRPFSGGSGYWGVNMDGFYAQRARSK